MIELKEGDHVFTPMGRIARVEGFLSGRVNLRYLEAEGVVLSHHLLRKTTIPNSMGQTTDTRSVAE